MSMVAAPVIGQQVEDMKQYLHREHELISKKIDENRKNDPVLFDTVPESSELGTEAWESEAHARSVALEDRLIRRRQEVSKTLKRVEQGTYDKCEQCHCPIEPERLRILRTTSFCASCAKERTIDW